jgi:uncharacterized membrane protein
MQPSDYPGQRGEGAPFRLPRISIQTLMGALSYAGPFVLVPLLAAKHDDTVIFHVRQGLILLTIEAGAWVVRLFLWPLSLFVSLAYLGAFILSLVGIVHVLQGKKKELPFVGQYAKHIPL